MSHPIAQREKPARITRRRSLSASERRGFQARPGIPIAAVTTLQGKEGTGKYTIKGRR